MLQVDLNDGDEKIAQFITAQCFGLGEVVSVTVHRSPTPFAVVLMARLRSATEFKKQYGGSTFGNSVLIHLEQKPCADEDHISWASSQA
jgi:hypothetical protein